jgi:TRAP-type mannitol/chloroaromatic compound transport system substrate-binding protein
MTTRRSLLTGLVAAPVLAAPALAQGTITWRMATSWSKNLAGPGVTARRLAERITALSGGRLVVQLFAAGEIVPAFSVLDAVSQGIVEMGHTASFFAEGRLGGVSLFTTAPFGLGPTEHAAWIAERDGQALWDELYRPLGARGFLAGNTGPSMGGWFRREIGSLDDLKGLRIRVSGLGGEVFRKLGAVAMAIPPGDTYVALERGTIDAVELLAPANDQPLGFQRIAPHYYLPGFNKPNGAAEAVVSLPAFGKLSPDLQAIVVAACEAEHAAGLASAEKANAEALTRLLADGARLATFPADVMTAARTAADAVLDETAAKSPMAGRIVASYRAALAAGKGWAGVQGYMARAIRA